MNPFDDTLPEEQETSYKELIELVQQVRRPPVPGNFIEQQQAIARVQQRLARQEYTDSQSESIELQLEDLDMQFMEDKIEQVGTSKSLPAGPAGVPGSVSHRSRRGRSLFRVLAAILVVGVLIGGSLVLFSRLASSTGPAIGPVGAPVTVRAVSNGFEMSMNITPGPYFLSELLAVDISLTNHTNTTYQLTGDLTQDSGCTSAFQATLTGGNSPSFTSSQKPISYSLLCLVIDGLLPLKPGQTISMRQYVLLTKSGQNTLTVQLAYPINAPTGTPDPFKGHELATGLNVLPEVPVDRSVLSLQQNGSEVMVTVPDSTHLQLIARSFVVCQDAQKGQQEAGDFYWVPLSEHTLDEPVCAGNNAQWLYDVGAAGYAIVSGELPT